MLSEHGLEGSQALWGLDVSDNTDDGNWWSLDDGDGLDGLLLVQLGAETIDVADDVRHTGLVAHEGGQMDRLGRVVLREGLALASMSARALLGQEAQ